MNYYYGGEDSVELKKYNDLKTCYTNKIIKSRTTILVIVIIIIVLFYKIDNYAAAAFSMVLLIPAAMEISNLSIASSNLRHLKHP
jgi:hypothetical protein